ARKNTNKHSSAHKYARDCYNLNLYINGDKSAPIDDIFKQSSSTETDNTIIDNNCTTITEHGSDILNLRKEVSEIKRSCLQTNQLLKTRIVELEKTVLSLQVYTKRLEAEQSSQFTKVNANLKLLNQSTSSIEHLNHYDIETKFMAIQSEQKKMESMLKKIHPQISAQKRRQPGTVTSGKYVSDMINMCHGESNITILDSSNSEDSDIENTTDSVNLQPTNMSRDTLHPRTSNGIPETHNAQHDNNGNPNLPPTADHQPKTSTSTLTSNRNAHVLPVITAIFTPAYTTPLSTSTNHANDASNEPTVITTSTSTNVSASRCDANGTLRQTALPIHTYPSVLPTTNSQHAALDLTTSTTSSQRAPVTTHVPSAIAPRAASPEAGVPPVSVPYYPHGQHNVPENIVTNRPYFPNLNVPYPYPQGHIPTLQPWQLRNYGYFPNLPAPQMNGSVNARAHTNYTSANNQTNHYVAQTNSRDTYNNGTTVQHENSGVRQAYVTVNNDCPSSSASNQIPRTNNNIQNEPITNEIPIVSDEDDDGFIGVHSKRLIKYYIGNIDKKKTSAVGMKRHFHENGAVLDSVQFYNSRNGNMYAQISVEKKYSDIVESDDFLWPNGIFCNYWKSKSRQSDNRQHSR
ncbi:MAG: hypothetical protein ABW185_28425, partial [Sedimenticola sp.]